MIHEPFTKLDSQTNPNLIHANLNHSELGLIAHASVTLYTFCMQVLGKGKAWIGLLTSLSASLQVFFAP